MTFPYMKNFKYGQKKYESFSDTDFSPPKKKSPIALAAERALIALPEEYKESVPELMLRVHPDWLYPHHLKPLYDAFDKIQRGESVRILLSVPPRYSKTESILFGLIRFLLTHSEKEIMYLSYAIDFAEQKSKIAKNYVLKLGAKIRSDSKALSSWTIDGVNSTFRASGLVGGQISGLGADILVIDDPHKGRVEAEQTILRDKIYDAFVTDALGRLSPNASVICVHCIAKGQKVAMADGTWKCIEDIAVGNKIISLEQETFVSNKVLNSKSSGMDQVYLVKTDRKSLRANSKHPILTKEGWKKVSELSVSDEIRVLDKGYGDIEIDEDFSWFFGFMIGDGWVTKFKKTNGRPKSKLYDSWCICFAAGVYEDLNQKVLNCFQKFFGKKPTYKTAERYYRLNSNVVGNNLQQLGLIGGAHGKRIPEWVFWLTPDLKRQFLRGYADADGHELKRPTDSVLIASVSKELMEDTRKLALSAGVSCTTVRRYEQIVKAPNSKEPKLSVMYKLHINFSKLPTSFEKIVSIAEDGVEEVFDLTVENSENFLVDGIVVHNTRFHPDDLIGRIIKNNDLGFTYINIPAVDENDNPLWPERWSKEELELKRKANEYAWASLYMGAPRPRGASLFNDIEKNNFYRVLPSTRLRYGVGYDLAYTAKTYADWSVAIVMATDGINSYVVNVVRKQCDATTFANILAELRSEYPPPIPFLSFISGPEKGSVSLLNSRGLKLSFLQAKTDKYDRAQSVSAAWNLGKIYLPESAPWLDDFMTEIKHFTGVNDPRDDQVDALAGAYATLKSTPPRRDFSNFF